MKNADIRGEAARKQRRDLLGLWAFFAVWGGGIAAGFYIFAIKAYTPLGAAITGTAALVGAYFIWHMFRMTADEAKFGVVSLVPSPRPALPGGKFQATLRFHDKAPDQSLVNAELRCVSVTLVWRSKSGIVPVEETAWSARADFPLRRAGVDTRAEIGFDIPGDAPATDLPGERPGESGWHSLQMEPGKALRYHRWELLVTAPATGIDLERSFPVVVGLPQNSAAPARAKAASNVVPIPKDPGRMVSTVIALAILAYFMSTFVSDINRSETRAQQQAAAPPAPAQKPPEQVGELAAQTPWTRDTQGWDLPLPAFSRAIGIAANGIRSTREKDSERFVFDEILIEMNPAWSHMEYFDVMVTVTYFPADLRPTVTLGGISTRLDDVRGTLTADRPAQRLRDLSVTAPLPKGEIGRTEVRLGINAVIKDPTSNFRSTHETSRILVLERK